MTTPEFVKEIPRAFMTEQQHWFQQKNGRTRSENQSSAQYDLDGEAFARTWKTTVQSGIR